MIAMALLEIKKTMERLSNIRHSLRLKVKKFENLSKIDENNLCIRFTLQPLAESKIK